MRLADALTATTSSKKTTDYSKIHTHQAPIIQPARSSFSIYLAFNVVCGTASRKTKNLPHERKRASTRPHSSTPLYLHVLIIHLPGCCFCLCFVVASFSLFRFTPPPSVRSYIGQVQVRGLLQLLAPASREAAGVQVLRENGQLPLRTELQVPSRGVGGRRACYACPHHRRTRGGGHAGEFWRASCLWWCCCCCLYLSCCFWCCCLRRWCRWSCRSSRGVRRGRA